MVARFILFSFCFRIFLKKFFDAKSHFFLKYIYKEQHEDEDEGGEAVGGERERK